MEETARVNEKKETVRYEERKRDVAGRCKATHTPTTKRNQYDTCTLKNLMYPWSSQCDKKLFKRLLLQPYSFDPQVSVATSQQKTASQKDGFFFSANIRPKPRKQTNRLSTIRKCPPPPSLSSLRQILPTAFLTCCQANLNRQYYLDDYLN